MSRPLRLDFPGAHFHITARGVDRSSIYADSQDRRSFLRILGTMCDRYGAVCHAYCLMDNHYHLLVESLNARISSAMQHLNGTHGRRFNRRWGRTGHLFQGRFHANLVEKESYLLEVVRYIELNPCRSGLVSHPVEWEWSSFRPRLGRSRVPACLCVETVLKRFGDESSAREGYARFIALELEGEDLDRKLRQEPFVGSERFVSHFANKARALGKNREVPRNQWLANRPSLARLLRAATHRDAKRQQAVVAFLDYGYAMTEIARELRVHYTTVSRWIRQSGNP